ncbi:MAG TPA: hypothetical protein VKG44_05950 [Candidatus Baltobacteraceae bacterium]|nr:hypothetical protein [Candidatus Baltobacteraceae bacterium]
MKYAGIDDASQAVFFALPFACLFATLTLVGAAFIFCAQRLGSASVDMVLGLAGARNYILILAIVVFAIAYAMLIVAKRAAVVRVALLLLALLPAAPLLGALFIMHTNGLATHFCGN